jgi:hypothetical protein
MTTTAELQSQCERGQELLMQTEYLDAEAVLAAAEADAWAIKDFDTLARLYMPLQEARRQRRQRCGEGVVCLDLIATGAGDVVDGKRIVENYPHGQLLVAGWQSIEPAVQVRRVQAEHKLYVDTFLAAAYPIGASGRVIVIVPTADVALPTRSPSSLDDLAMAVPAHSIVLTESELPKGIRKGNTETYGEVMAMWERLHLPFLAAADMQDDSIKKMDGYRKTTRVDYACELAHQKLSDVARQMSRR